MKFTKDFKSIDEMLILDNNWMKMPVHICGIVKNVHISNNLSYVGDDYMPLNFNQFTSVEHITFGDKLKDIKASTVSFIACNNLKEIDLTPVGEVYNLEDSVFRHNYDLTKLVLPSNFSNGIQDSLSYWFDNARSIKTLNLSSLDTSNVKEFQDVFSECNSLEILNISNWDFSKAKHTTNMIWSCGRLKKLIACNISGEANISSLAIKFKTAPEEIIATDCSRSFINIIADALSALHQGSTKLTYTNDEGEDVTIEIDNTQFNIRRQIWGS